MPLNVLWVIVVVRVVFGFQSLWASELDQNHARPTETTVKEKKLQIEFPVEKIVLENGMTFLLHAQPSIPMVSFHTWFRVGAKDELVGESGLAHMFEHMMFKGTQRYPNKVFDRILQANGIINNAFTTQDYTGYYEILPSSKLELIMDMESDRMKSLVLKEEELEKEREVVLEERRMRYDNDPQGMIWEELNGLVFQSTPYSLPVIGTVKDIKDYNVPKMQKFYQKWYTPSNAVVVIVGDFEVSKVKGLIQKYYGSLTSSPRPVHLPFVASESPAFGKQNGKQKGIKFSVQSPELMWGWKTTKSGTDESYALDIMAIMLGHGKSSYLYKEIAYKKQLALSVGTSQYSLQEDGMFMLEATAHPRVSGRKLKEAIEQALDRWLKTPVQEKDLIKAKNIVLSGYVLSLKTNDAKARTLAVNEILFGDYQEFFRDIERYQKITIQDVERVKKYIFKKQGQFTFITNEGVL